MGQITTEALMTLLTVLAVMALPVAVGLGIYKGYRLLRPLPEVEELNHFSDIDKIGDRAFLKSVVIGWLICGPFYYWLFSTQAY